MTKLSRITIAQWGRDQQSNMYNIKVTFLNPPRICNCAKHYQSRWWLNLDYKHTQLRWSNPKDQVSNDAFPHRKCRQSPAAEIPHLHRTSLTLLDSRAEWRGGDPSQPLSIQHTPPPLDKNSGNPTMRRGWWKLKQSQGRAIEKGSQEEEC